MMKSEAESYLDNWYAGTNKIFEYKQEFLPIEYIMIEKIDMNEFKTNKKDSTYNLEIKDRDYMVKLMTSGQLIYNQEYTWRTPLELKTGGCDCGAWAIGDGKHHAHWCKKEKK